MLTVAWQDCGNIPRQAAGAGAVALLALATALLALACSKSGDLCKNGIDADISGNHGHELVPPKTKGGRHSLIGGTHEHGLALTATDVTKLEAGESVTTRVSSRNAHTHEVNLKCK